MTDIDARTDIGIFYNDDYDLMVVIPLAGEVTQMWRRRYEALARARGLRAQVHERKGSTVIHLVVPVRTEGEDVLKMLDAARALIAEADDIDRSPAASDAPEAIARRWWARQQALRGQPPSGSNHAPKRGPRSRDGTLRPFAGSVARLQPKDANQDCSL